MPKFKVLLHDTWGNAKEGWEVNQSFNHGTIEVEVCTPRTVIKALRDQCGMIYDSRRMAPLGPAMHSTPYIGGHIDLCERNGKPVGFLEKIEDAR